MAYSIVHKNLPMMTRSFRSKGRMSMSESMVRLTLAEINGCIPADSADEGINAVLANQSSNFTNIQKAVCRVSLFFVVFFIFIFQVYIRIYGNI